NEQYYGVGLGASGYIDNYRYYNTKSITNYLKGSINQSKEIYENKQDYLRDEIMLKFRIYNGIDIQAIATKYQIDFTVYFNKALMLHQDHLSIINNQLYFNKQGQRILNDIIIDFMDCIK
ncbi:MAG: hypothetical protein ACRCTA_05465, partial [Bacilli bacterium]